MLMVITSEEAISQTSANSQMKLIPLDWLRVPGISFRVAVHDPNILYRPLIKDLQRATDSDSIAAKLKTCSYAFSEKIHSTQLHTGFHAVLNNWPI